jgi:hypothetical protein
MAPEESSYSVEPVFQVTVMPDSSGFKIIQWSFWPITIVTVHRLAGGVASNGRLRLYRSPSKPFWLQIALHKLSGIPMESLGLVPISEGIMMHPVSRSVQPAGKELATPTGPLPPVPMHNATPQPFAANPPTLPLVVPVGLPVLASLTR